MSGKPYGVPWWAKWDVLAGQCECTVERVETKGHDNPGIIRSLTLSYTLRRASNCPVHGDARNGRQS